MFRNLFLFTFFFCSSFIARSQKKFIDTASFNTWTTADNPLISNDGKYVSYRINNQPIGRSTIVLQSVDGKFNRQFVGGSNAWFSIKGDLFFYSKPDGGCTILKLKERKEDSIPGARRIELVKSEKHEWLLYYTDDGLTVEDYELQRKESFSGITSHEISSDGSVLAIISKKKDFPDVSCIDLVNLKSFYRKSIWSGQKLLGIKFDKSGDQLFFLAENLSGTLGQSIWYYKMGMNDAVRLEQVDSLCNKLGMVVTGRNVMFTGNGEQINFFLEFPRVDPAKKKGVKVDVWSYMDDVLQSRQLKLQNSSRGYLYFINIATRELIKATLQDESVLDRVSTTWGEDVLLTQSTYGELSEAYWNPRSGQNTHIVFSNSGKRITLGMNDSSFLRFLKLSPTGKFAVYYDSKKGNYFSYNLETGVTKNITKGIKADWTGYNVSEDVSLKDIPIGISGWLKSDQAILINSYYDIWQVDPEAVQPPINLTGTGERNIAYCLAIRPSEDECIKDKNILIKAFNIETKESGFYRLDLGKKRSFVKLSMGNYLYERRGTVPYTPLDRIDYTMTLDSNACIIGRQDASHSLNYYFTRDFISFSKISNIHPESVYNWMTTELHSFQLPDGRKSIGILYKPENFDPGRKYPVVFNFYQKLSDDLNEFKEASAVGGGNISIPYFVSNEYLVFIPDILYDDEVGKSALISVESAARYMAQFPWVDSSRMGLSAHSFGGFEANYITTHSKIFAATVSGAGVSNMTSAYGSLWGSTGRSKQSLIERGYYRLGTTYWQNVKKYIEMSPIFYVDRVVNPVLLMHNYLDEAVSFAQSIEFYTALRRAGKIVWLLQYDGENHTNVDPRTRLDITIRIKQFFDHYLKGLPAPRWMIRGVPASLKGIDSGLSIDEK